MANEKDSVLATMPPPGKPVGIVAAISEIQQYYVVERQGNTVSAEFLTLKGKLSFMEIGFKAAFISGLVSALMTPISIGVLQQYIPIFGSYDPTLFDKAFALLLSVSFALGYAFFLATLGKYYIGEITKTAIKNLIGGFASGAILKMILVFIFFHFTFFVLLEETRLANWLLKLTPMVKHQSLEHAYNWIINFKPVLLTSAYFVVFTTLLTIVIPVISILIQSKKIAKIMEKEEAWK